MGLLKEKIFTTLVAGIDVSPAEVEQAFKEQNTKIKFDYAFLAAEDLQKQLNPPDAELKVFYTKNQDRYKNSVPEKRQIRYFVVDDKAVQNKVAVTPNDLQQYYTAHMDEYRTPERVKVRHILIKTPIAGPDGKVDQKGVDAARAKAEDILKQLKNGANFAELAKKYSEDSSAQDGGELKGWQTRDNDLVPEFKNAAFSLNKGQMSDLVQTNFGFHIIQVEDKEAALLKPFADVKSQIEDVVNKRKIASALNEMADTAQTQARADGLDKAAAKIGAQVVQTNPIAQKDSLPGIGATPGFMRAVFGANEKSRPEIAPLSQGYAIFQITKIDPARLAPLEEIKDQVATDFKAEQINTLLPKKTAELADRAHALHDLRKAAQELGATVKTSDLVTRTATVSDIGSLSGQAAGEAFHLKPGEISGAINLGAKGVVIALTDRQEPSLGDEFAKAKDQTREQLRNRKQQQALNLFLANLRSRLEKEGREKINKNAMENLMKPRG
jgi:peptidyl-prolyl cis-trans isomerase D